eukprot:2738651-Pleurochrysis_carterae.AAC.1
MVAGAATALRACEGASVHELSPPSPAPSCDPCAALALPWQTPRQFASAHSSKRGSGLAVAALNVGAG